MHFFRDYISIFFNILQRMQKIHSHIISPDFLIDTNNGQALFINVSSIKVTGIL